MWNCTAGATVRLVSIFLIFNFLCLKNVFFYKKTPSKKEGKCPFITGWRVGIFVAETSKLTFW